MVRKIARNMLAVLALAACGVAVAQTSGDVTRPVTSSFMIEAGSSSILDTYLTPLKYKGYHVRLEYERLQAMRFNPEKWIMQMNAGIDYDNVKNQAGNHVEHSLMVDFRWTMMHRWRNVFTPGLQLAVGGDAQFRGGAIYKPSNSNNVASAKIHAAVGLSAMATYSTKLWGMPVTARYQATLPVAGVFFSPEYGETYYEMYVGNHGSLAHFGWWANRFDMINMVSLDMHLGTTVLRVGYRNRVESSWVNNLSTQMCTHAAVLGVGGDWMSLRKNSGPDKVSKIISAMY